MKKLIALMLAMTLALSALSAVAEELHTFAGISWSTGTQDFVAVAKENKLLFQGRYYSSRYSDYNGYSFVLEDGFYSVLGIPIHVTDGEVTARYASSSDSDGSTTFQDASSWYLDCISCKSMPQPLRGNPAEGEIRLEDMQLAQDVINQAINRYGTPDWVETEEWLVPAEEYAHIARDAVAFSVVEDSSYCDIVCAFGNVELDIEVELPDLDDDYEPGEYTITLSYYCSLLDPADEEDMETFPMLNGEITYIVIEP